MPTGYTAAVGSGKVTEFCEFAMQCARAFGALVLMRDDPSDAQIPEEFQPSDYHHKCLADSRRELARIEALTDDEAAKECETGRAQDVAYAQKQLGENTLQIARYRLMLAMVNAWNPPSEDHIEMKRFMESQLMESIKFDNSLDYYSEIIVREPKSGASWRRSKVESLRRDIKYHEEKYAEELDRTAKRNQWIKQLRESLSPDHAVNS